MRAALSEPDARRLWDDGQALEDLKLGRSYGEFRLHGALAVVRWIADTRHKVNCDLRSFRVTMGGMA